LRKLLLTLVAALASLGATGAASAQSCAPPLVQALEVDLYFGRASVSDAQWAAFLSEEVTPRFPDGLSVLDVAGQWRAPGDQKRGGPIVRENSKLMTIIVFDAPTHAPKVEAIVEAYKVKFKQQSVLRVEHAVCAAL
jgi:hypothetical protein